MTRPVRINSTKGPALAAAGLMLALSGPIPSSAADVAPQRVEISAGSYYFRPDRVVVEKDVPVELVLESESYITPHNFVIDSPEAGMEVRAKLTRTPTTVRFTPTRTGEYPFWCDNKLLFFESHRAKGMEGTIVVIDPGRPGGADGSGVP